MGRRIDWYMVELERMLKGSIPLESLHELQTETRSHLESARDLLLAKGCDPDDSEIEAIKDFGNPKHLALATIKEREQRPGKWAVWLVAAIGLLCFVNPFAAFLTPRIFFGNLAWFWAITFIAFVGVGLWARRSLYLPVLSTAAVAGCLMALFLSHRLVDLASVGGYGTVHREEIATLLAQQDADRRDLQSLIAEFDKGKDAFKSDEKLDSAWNELRYPVAMSRPGQYRNAYLMSWPPIRSVRYDSRELLPEDRNAFRKEISANAKDYRSGLVGVLRSQDEYVRQVRAAAQLPDSANFKSSAFIALGMASTLVLPGLLLIELLRWFLDRMQGIRIAKRALA